MAVLGLGNVALDCARVLLQVSEASRAVLTARCLLHGVGLDAADWLQLSKGQEPEPGQWACCSADAGWFQNTALPVPTWLE